MLVNKRQIRQIHAILGVLGIMDQKADLVSEVSGGRCESSRELTFHEADQLITHLRSLQEVTTSPKPLPEGNKIRRSIMSMAYTLHIINERMSNAEKIEAIDTYVLNHPKTGEFKPFSTLSVKELQALHYQFERFLLNKLEKAS